MHSLHTQYEVVGSATKANFRHKHFLSFVNDQNKGFDVDFSNGKKQCKGRESVMKSVGRKM